MARIQYIMVPTDYVNELMQQAKREKARCFLEYFHDFQMGEVNSYSFYAKSWGKKGNGTPSKWIGEFKREIEKFFNYWSLKNEEHYSSVSNKSGRKVDDIKNKSGYKKSEQTPINKGDCETKVDDIKNKSGRKVEQDLNSLNNNNINAESNDSACKKSSNKKYEYSKTFEIIWNLYDKKTSNKNRSYSIFKKRWSKTDIELIKKAIEQYKHITDPTYIKDFDGFLNGLIDSYIPKRAWVKDKFDNKHVGFFHDNQNKFISDKGDPLTIQSEHIAKYMEDGKFGYEKVA
jgi:hypothetical protein